MHCRIISVLLALGTASLLIAQSSTITLSPNWRLGDKRQVDVQVETKVTIDTIVMSTKGSSTYYLEVTSARKDGYELKVRSGSMETPTMDMGLGADFAAEMDSAQASIGAIIDAVYEPFSKWEARYRLDRSGKVLGLVDGKGDKEKLTKAMQQAIENVFKTMATDGEGPEQIPQAAISHLVDSLYDAFMEVQVNEMSYFLEIYGTAFPLTGSMRQAVLVENVQAPLYAGIPKSPGILEIGIDKNDDAELVGRTIITYDRDAVFASMKDEFPEGFTSEGLYLDEECVERFDKRTGWLTRSTTAVRFRSATLKIDVLMQAVLKVIR